MKFYKCLIEICKLCLRGDDFLVDLEKCCKMRPWLQKSASIQPRTSPTKICKKKTANFATLREVWRGGGLRSAGQTEAGAAVAGRLERHQERTREEVPGRRAPETQQLAFFHP